MAMAPFPDEVDVFTAPHWRMKQLVGRYCDKVTERGAEGGAEERAGSGRPGLRASRRPRVGAVRSAACAPSAARLPHLPARSLGSPRRPRPGTCLRGARRLPSVLLAGLACAGVRGAPGTAAAVPSGLERPGSVARGSSRSASAGRFCGCSPPRDCPPGPFGLFESLCKHCVPRLDL